MISSVHWFPGHMKKALKEIEERLKVIDVVIELIDARAPISSINPQLEKTIKYKKRILILTKIDLADPKKNDFWVEFLKKQYDVVLSLDLTQASASKTIERAIALLGKDKWAKEKAKGMKTSTNRTMIIGIPMLESHP